MSRHALHPARSRRRRPFAVLLALLLTVVLAGALMVQLDATPERLRTLTAKAPIIGATCPSTRLPTTTISLTVAPELQSTISQALDPLVGRTLPERECVRVTVQAQEPAETVQSSQILPLDRAPDLWISDSSLWESRVPKWTLKQEGSFAASPVVIASSQKVLDKLGWSDKAPSWLAALAGDRPLAVPRIAEDAAGLSAVIALWQSLGKGEQAQAALAGTVLAAGRADVPTEAEAIAAAESGSESAPLLPTSEQAVAAANAGSSNAPLVAVRPTGGSPSLDYPVLTLRRPAGGQAGSAVRARAMRAVVAQLFGSRTAGIVQSAGFQLPEGRATTPETAGVLAATADEDGTTPVVSSSPSPIVGLAPQELAELVNRVTLLSAPSRILTIFDLSRSMLGDAGNGQNRIELAATAATLAGNLLTDRAQVGIWGFSRDLRGTRDIVKIEAVAELGEKKDGVTHRQRVNGAMASAERLLGGNGTALFSAAVAGMKEMKKLYDPRAGNAVVLFTDGANADPGGPSLKKTLAELTKLYDPKRPVRLLCIGIGDGVDMKELRAMAAKAGGQAYLTDDPKDLPAVLFAALNGRKA